MQTEGIRPDPPTFRALSAPLINSIRQLGWRGWSLGALVGLLVVAEGTRRLASDPPAAIAPDRAGLEDIVSAAGVDEVGTTEPDHRQKRGPQVPASGRSPKKQAATSGDAGKVVLNGVYQGGKEDGGYNAATNRYVSRWVATTVLLAPNGLARWGLPGGLIDQFDIDDAMKNGAPNLGRWTMSGRKLTISWKNGNTMIATVYSSDRFRTSRGVQLQRLEPVRGPFTGSFFHRSSTATDNQGGSVSGEHSVHFSRNGTIRIQDDVMGDSRGGNASGGITGRYTISGYTLRVISDDGRKRDFNFWIPSGPSNPPTAVTLNGTVYGK